MVACGLSITLPILNVSQNLLEPIESSHSQEARPYYKRIFLGIWPTTYAMAATCRRAMLVKPQMYYQSNQWLNLHPHSLSCIMENEKKAPVSMGHSMSSAQSNSIASIKTLSSLATQLRKISVTERIDKLSGSSSCAGREECVKPVSSFDRRIMMDYSSISQSTLQNSQRRAYTRT
jgi:hypothetical protein